MTNPSVLSVEVVCDCARWDALRSEWDALFDQHERPSPALRFDWMREWWRAYGTACAASDASLRIVTFRRGSTLVGLLPLYVSRSTPPIVGARTLMFLSTGEREDEQTCAEHLDLLHVPGEADACMSALDAALRTSLHGWDTLSFVDLTGPTALASAANGFGGGTRLTWTSQAESPYAKLEDGFEQYLTRLSSRTRQHMRQLLRGAERAAVVLEIADAATAPEFYAQLIDLHQARWIAAGKPGCFAAPRFKAFHAALIERSVPSGAAVLARLTHQGRTFAVVYGFVAGGKFDFYQSGVQIADAPLNSPGITMQLMLMRWLAASRGITAYDFLKGSHEYKSRLATDCGSLATLDIRRPAVRNLVQAAAAVTGQAARRAVSAASAIRSASMFRRTIDASSGAAE